MCNGFMDPGQLAIEAKTEEERVAQAWGTQEPNPSVITMNAVAAAHAINDFLFDDLGLRASDRQGDYLHAHYVRPAIKPLPTVVPPFSMRAALPICPNTLRACARLISSRRRLQRGPKPAVRCWRASATG